MAEILVIDDELGILMLVRMMLGREGYEVVEARSGRDGLERLKKKKPDLILLDIMMPGEDGWEICKKIKNDGITRNIPVVMLSVYDRREAVERSRECGADAHIVKPFDRALLVGTVKKFLEKAVSR